MKNINVGLIRLFQFVVFVFFIFIVMTYFGALLLLPLDAVYLLIKLMSAIGFNDMLAVLLAVPAIAFLGMKVYKMPGFCKLLLQIGIDLVDSGKNRVEAFNKLAEEAKN